jgi:deoxyribodipyrimidine photolyase
VTSLERDLALLEAARLAGWRWMLSAHTDGYDFRFYNEDSTDEPRTVGATTATGAISELVRAIHSR